MSKYNLLDIHEGKSFEDSQEKSREEKHPEKKTIDKIRALMAKEKKVDENEAVDLAIEASQAKAGIKEARVDRDVEERIEGLLHRELKRKFLFAFEDLYSDLIEEDPFHAEDVINHLNNEMHKHLSSFQNTGDKFAGIEETDDFYDELEEGAMQPGEADLESGVKGNMDAYTEGKGVDFIKALKVDANGTNLEIKSYLESLKRSGDKFDSVDDYVEDFKNYVADKSLQEHFGRFMKDYQ